VEKEGISVSKNEDELYGFLVVSSRYALLFFLVWGLIGEV
jgi:hypothetical protein